MNEVVIARAKQADLSGMQELLLNNKLPADDVAEHLGHFLVAKNGDTIVGTVGLEVYEGNALLRSLAVDEAHRNKGIAKSLYERLLTYGKEKHVRHIALLTTTAEGYFAKQGFVKVRREEIPEFVKKTKEYKEFCPSSAACMVKAI